MADIEEELTAYAARRMGGRTPRAAQAVTKAARQYKATVAALQRFGASSPRFWDALEVLSLALDDILYGFPGDADFYFSPRQWDELVLPALQAITPAASHPRRWHIGQQISVIGDLVIHVNCEALSEEQQLGGARELLRCLGALPRDEHEADTRYCLVNAMAKVVFVGTGRDQPPYADFQRAHSEALALEVARGGGFKAALRMLGSPPPSSMMPGMAMGGPGGDPGALRDEGEAHALHSAQCMAAALASNGDAATVASIGRWAAKRPGVLATLMGRLRRQNPDQDRHVVMPNLSLAGHLAAESPELLAELRREGLADALADLRRRLRRPEDVAEVDRWVQRLVAPPSSSNGDGPQQQQRQLPAATRDELASLPVRELKARLQAAGIDSSSCAEKGELVDLLLAAQASGNNGSSSSADSSGGAQPAAQQEQGGQPAAPAAPEAKQCATCGVKNGPDVKLRLCSACKHVKRIYFCSAACQKAAWPSHKAECRAAQGK